MYVRMQELMEESGAYVFLTHELNAAVYRDHDRPGAPARRHRALRRVQAGEIVS